MSGVVKSIGKVFKKVVNTASKILPVALAAGAVMFTAGNALGITSSWGEAVKGVTDSLGAGSGLSSIITGAVTNAGYGAVAGAATSALSGGDALQGAQYGAAAGAVLGGAQGAYDSYASGSTPASAATGNDAASSGARIEGGGQPSDTPQGGVAGGGATMKPAVAPSAVTSGAASSSADAGAGIIDKGGWLERNGALVGNVLLGVGKGLAGADANAQTKALQQQADIVRQNYGLPRVGLLTGTQTTNTTVDQGPPRMTPAQRFSPTAYGATGQGQYVYDPSTGRYTLVQS
ncbi:hypothetical protein D3877_12040 [Azospirillum cavernae]|uniref:Uncharacterized protein n=1 Tax=Azospirillum cavernae TaxID=2320860 RepID=A0A418VUW8_9PROT|nr:hypothetical protein [Azospirillum cavernae]RJF80957.1 hypothetical protein D3877_12040 [Azospirillum cavernae]